MRAWLLLAAHLLNADIVYRFIGVATEVLEERDPLDDLSGNEHFEAQLRGVGRKYSRALRLGVARTLALLCIHGSGVSLNGGRDASDLARRCVQQLLEPDADTGTSIATRVRRLAELGEVMPLLAEAAPDEFVAAVDQTLQPRPEAARLWFTDSQDDLGIAGTSSPHAHLPIRAGGTRMAAELPSVRCRHPVSPQSAGPGWKARRTVLPPRSRRSSRIGLPRPA